MDQDRRERADGDGRKRVHLERLAAGLSEGLFLVDSKGEVLCVLQDVTRHRRSGNGLIGVIEAIVGDTSALGRVIVQRLSALRNGPSDGRGSGVDLDQLSEREREVLGLICEGQSDASMSKTLGLSRYTVRNHIAALYRKIGVNRRSAAVIWARERGITSEQALTPRPNRRSIWHGKRNGQDGKGNGHSKNGNGRPENGNGSGHTYTS